MYFNFANRILVPICCNVKCELLKVTRSNHENVLNIRNAMNILIWKKNNYFKTNK